ncbi:MAG: hypothetical protein J6V07_03145 [Clostridia bacterium]|nr:hypothetical protein [Clostridia bacterium]
MEKHSIAVTARDRLYHAWQEAVTMIRLLEASANEEGVRSEAGRLFAACAERECQNAAEMLALLGRMEGK